MSIGLKLGSAVGFTAASIVHGATVSVKATGRFGRDVVAGTEQGYAERKAALTTLRQAVTAQAMANNEPVAPKRARRADVVAA